MLDNLKNPHNLKLAGNNFVLCNTSANNVLILNNKLRVRHQIGEGLGMSWVQDAIYSQTSNTIIVADADNNRLIEVDQNNNVIDEYFFSKSNRIYELKELVV